MATPARNPLLAVQFVIDERGEIKGDVQVDTFEKKILSIKENQIVESLKIVFRGLLSVFPEGHISTGDEVFSPEQFAEQYGKSVAELYPNSTITFLKNTYSGRAVGISNEFNRPNLVVKLSGLMEMKFGRDGQGAVETTGHEVFDLGTGLPISRVRHYTLSGIKDGERITAEQITIWKVTEVQY